MRKIKNRKGETSTMAIIGWIMFALGILIVLALVFRLNPGKITEQEVCHNSVVMRSTAISASSSLKGIIPLNCKTQSVCISNDGTCESLVSPEIKKIKDKEGVYSVLANQLTDCWWTFGEGKVDYVGTELAAGNLYCSLCSQIAFDDSVTKIEGLENGIDNSKFYKYLENTTIPNKDITYWNYLYEGSTPEEIETSLKQKDSSYGFGTINLNRRYYIAMGIMSKTFLEPWMLAVAGGVVAVGVTALSGGTSLILLAAVGAGGAGVTGAGAYAGQYVGRMITGESGQQYLHPVLIEASSDFDKLKCKNVNTFT